MFRAFSFAAAVALAAPALAFAQVDGAIPNSGNDASYFYRGIGSYGIRRSPEETARELQIESNYRAAMQKIPDRKPSNDPWKSVRPAAAARAADRHTQPQ